MMTLITIVILVTDAESDYFSQETAVCPNDAKHELRTIFSLRQHIKVMCLFIGTQFANANCEIV